jgi:isoamylase
LASSRRSIPVAEVAAPMSVTAPVGSVPPGSPDPLGATYDGAGVNFALYSENATKVELCLFGPKDGREKRILLPYRTNNVFHGYVAGLKPGQGYGFRVHGPYEPRAGHRFNPRKLLVDPYARQIRGELDYKAPLQGHADDKDDSADVRDDGAGIPRSVVVDDRFDWGSDQPPRVSWADTLIYEAHVKGMTKLHPEVPPELRGTYAGLGTPAVMKHLTSLGVTAIELLPVHHAITEPALAGRGVVNYWGYSTLGFFAPDPRWARDAGSKTCDPVREFKEMVKALHAAGIEVLLDVVYNHTCEGDRFGPTLCLRGVDNRVYYRLDPSDPRRTSDYTGCGNTLDTSHPQTLALVMDSLRYWVTVMHVDGFRFDLAPALARERDGRYDRGSAFFDILHQDPVLSKVKLISEPWDLGNDGYQVGNFPTGWGEWNGRYRDTVRRFWRGQRETVGDMGYRMTASSDLFAAGGRSPQASVNFVTVHDGFSLRDLVSYDRKHNEANGEGNRDGSDGNDSWNGGVEGETGDAGIAAARERRIRTFLSTIYLSFGVPMIRMGDEVGQSQGGNNNAYCQDNAVSWTDWAALTKDPRGASLLRFTQSLAAIRKAHPTFRKSTFFRGTTVGGSRERDLVWFSPAGQEMHGSDWRAPSAAALVMRTQGDALGVVDRNGVRVTDDSFLLVLNAEHKALDFLLPDAMWGERWARVITSAADVDTQRQDAATAVYQARATVNVPPSTLLLLRLLRAGE